jgi:hypothetical protein
MASNPSNPSPGADATARAKAAMDEFRRRAAARAGFFGHPGITIGPSFGGPFGPGTPPFPFPGQPADSAQPTAVDAGTSLFQSLGTMLRLGVDLLNSGLQGFMNSAGPRSGGCSCGGSCGCEQSCCAQFAAPGCGCGGGCSCGGNCGCGCGGGCNPSVRNC